MQAEAAENAAPGLAWLVVMTHPHSEGYAEAALARIGCEVCLPRYRRRLVGIRIDGDGRRIRTRGPGSIVRRPLFPAYLFVQHDADRGALDIATSPGVARVLRHRSGRPKLLADDVVDEIIRRCEAGEFDMVGTRHRRLDIGPGDAVRIGNRAGTWSDHLATLVELDDAGRAQVLIELLGRMVPVDVPAEALALVSRC